MNVILKTLAAAAALAAASAFAADDVGLINHMIGDVSYASGGATAKAKPFMKLREGDRVSVPSGALVRVVYFQGEIGRASCRERV